MKKFLMTALVLAGISANAQVKVGNNPTTIDTGTTNFQVEGTTTAEQFVILKDGKVGIGTLTPSQPLQVLGTAELGSRSNFISGSLILNNHANSRWNNTINFGKSRAGAIIQENDIIGSMDFWYYNGSAYADRSSFIEFFAVNPNVAGNKFAGRMIFRNYTNSGSINNLEFDHRGNLGVNGTLAGNLNSRLKLGGYIQLGSSDITADALTTVSDRAGMLRYNSTSSIMEFHNSTDWRGIAPYNSIFVPYDRNGSGGNNALRLDKLSNGTDRASNTSIQITDLGNFGVGVNNPLAKIHTVGSLLSTNTSPEDIVRIGRAPGGGLNAVSAGIALGQANTGSTTIGRLDFNVSGISLYENSYGNVPNSTIMTLTGYGNVGIGTTAPTTKLEVAGTIKIGDSNDATPTAGMIRFNAGTSKFQGYDGTAWVDLH